MTGNRYAILTEINCITQQEYWPCGTSNVFRVDKRLTINNALESVSRHTTDKTVRVVIVEGEFNRSTSLKIVGSEPYADPKTLSEFIN